MAMIEVFTHPGIAIEIDADRLQGVAMKKQAEWFADPTSLERKGEFAMALRHWAKETGNKRALAHALSLEQECQEVTHV